MIKPSKSRTLLSIRLYSTTKSTAPPTIRATAINGASQKLAQSSLPTIPSPRILKSFLDEYVIGQDVSKKVLSVSVYNHYLRIYDRIKRQKMKESQLQFLEANVTDQKDEPTFVPNSEAEQGMANLKRQVESLKPENDPESNGVDDLELSKSNVMVIGPSGSGKTLLATTLARVLDVPIAISDCTQLTQAGYIGEDVEVCIERLLVNADFDVAKAERGIIVLDEIDKLAKPSASIGTKDVSGEGVQQSLLKIIEGHRVQISVKRPVKNKSSSTDKDGNKSVVKKEETFTIDTSNILFMIMGAFVGLDKHVAKRIKTLKQLDEPEKQTEEGEEEENKEHISNKLEEIELENGEKVPALNLATPVDLVTFGLIPELIGRVPIITALQPLQRDDLYHILKEPKNALLDQYEYIFKQFGVRLCITDQALKKVSQFALNEGTGARGLRGIMERLLLNINYECPESGTHYVLINEKTVNSLQQTKYSLASNVQAKYYSRGQIFDLINDVSKEDKELAKKLDIEVNGVQNLGYGESKVKEAKI
ncbi:similar to Saccharomyces cerevisiae YBR227C MCX1 Mitochondrial matrix protein [Maudiozyma saulgeensis]|uniref:Similar to Saccharomyces cerevisiae YBR227C MCX1 Mitochondrial matrix protein n=1 Tax=Maudiozyma saulgeensis TaxID=1789683 RepID=A0A1X7R0A8_9SACH|nr:similar to Saccharomyces cerevisiae YBR227C MCX1 Mitochondrial matrix protein [Kazachstania saulgeensis]